MALANNRPLDPLVVAGEAESLAENIVIPHAEQSEVLVRSNGVGRLWVEQEYDELEHEQPALWRATAVAAAQESQLQVAQFRVAATETTQIVADDRRLVDDARDRLLRTMLVLAAFRRRAKGTKLWYQLAKAGLLLGDIAGFGTAAIWLGELPVIALTLAASAAVATIAAGLLGVDIRDRELRRQRQRAVPEPSAAQQEFPHLFTADEASVTIRRVLIVASSTAGTLGIGIAALRSAVDDPFIGLVFGGIALAVAGGSFLVSYAGADEVADLIEHAEAAYARAVSTHLQYSERPAIAQFERATAAQDNILAEHVARGEAAAHRVRALKWGILRRNPRHAGHGLAAGRAVPIGGQTPRRGETAA